MAAALWAALRQIEALKTSFIFTLKALKPHQSHFPDYGTELTQNFWDAPGSDIAIRAMTQGTLSSQPIEIDHGVERSSASWDNFENFTTTSMHVRLLGALEQFEYDALKSLLFYRPLGSTPPPQEYTFEDVSEQVVFEKSEYRNQIHWYQLPVLWTWLYGSAIDKDQRAKILSRVYGVERLLPEFGKNYKELYNDRNAIAHGRESVAVSLDEILHLYGFVLKSIFHIRDQVSEKYRLNL